MDSKTKISLDNVVKRLQAVICVEYNKYGLPDQNRVNDYLRAICVINEEFGTKYSITPKEYNITKLPAKD